MRDAKLFRIGQDSVQALFSSSVALEKSLQVLIERHLETLLGVRFVATEHATGAVHGGRIDTLGLDENSCPVIIEYKRALNENVINQGLFYLNWLMDHKAEFTLLVLKKYGQATADAHSMGRRERRLADAADHRERQRPRTGETAHPQELRGELAHFPCDSQCLPMV